MDTLAHGLWAYAIFHEKRYAKIAALYSVLPDISSFGMFLIISLAMGTIDFSMREPPPLEIFPKWIFMSYTLTHSLIVFLFVFFIVYFITKKPYWPLTGWALHTLIDIPTHSSRFFPTPFLWPLSDYTFNGIGWATPWFMIINYSFLVIAYSYIMYTTKFKNRKGTIRQYANQSK